MSNDNDCDCIDCDINIDTENICCCSKCCDRECFTSCCSRCTATFSCFEAIAEKYSGFLSNLWDNLKNSHMLLAIWQAPWKDKEHTGQLNKFYWILIFVIQVVLSMAITTIISISDPPVFDESVLPDQASAKVSSYVITSVFVTVPMLVFQLIFKYLINRWVQFKGQIYDTMWVCRRVIGWFLASGFMLLVLILAFASVFPNEVSSGAFLDSLCVFGISEVVTYPFLFTAFYFSYFSFCYQAIGDVQNTVKLGEGVVDDFVASASSID